MSLLIGQPISADELEQVTSTWPPERFATLCNTMAWAASGRAFQTFPSFTSRINVKDGGVDAEWTVEIPSWQRTYSHTNSWAGMERFPVQTARRLRP